MMPNPQRAALIEEALRTGDLDALVCGAPPNVLMLTGYWPMTGTSVTISARNGRTSLIVPEDERHFAAGGSVVTYQPSSINRLTSATEGVTAPLREALERFGLDQSRIGVEEALFVPVPYASVYSWGATLSHVTHEVCPDAVLVRAGPILRRLRSVLTASEQHNLRHACAVAADAFRVGRTMIAEGTMERAIAGSVQDGFAQADAVRAGGFAFCMSGPNSARADRAYAYSGLRPVAEGDLVLIHCNSYVGGYWTDITRTYTLGGVDSHKRKLYEAVFRARDAALACIRPGVTGAEVDRAARDSIEGDGFGDHFSHATGHGVGFAAIDHDAVPRLHPASQDRLEPGMVVNVEPAIYIEHFGGIRHCDMVAVTAHGPEVLTAFHSTVSELELT